MLTTVSATKTYLGITDTSADAVLIDLLASADKAIKNYLGRSIEITTKTLRIKTDGDDNLFFLDYPILTASGVTVTHSVSTSTTVTFTEGVDYYLDAVNGEIEFESRPLGGLANYYTISYTCGYSSVPEDLELACIRIVAGLYKNAGGGTEQIGGITNERLGDYSISYGESVNFPPNSSTGIGSNSISQLINNESVVLDLYKNTYV